MSLAAVNNTYSMCHAMELQANSWHDQRMFEKAKVCRQCSMKKIGAAKNIGDCRKLLGKVDELDLDGELLQTMLLPAHVDFPF